MSARTPGALCTESAYGLIHTREASFVKPVSPRGKRRILIPANLGCFDGRAAGQSLDKGDSPSSPCMLVQSGVKGKHGTKVRKLPLIVDATLTASCTLIFMQILSFYTR
jgi:hypothetical protein